MDEPREVSFKYDLDYTVIIITVLVKDVGELNARLQLTLKSPPTSCNWTPSPTEGRTPARSLLPSQHHAGDPGKIRSRWTLFLDELLSLKDVIFSNDSWWDLNFVAFCSQRQQGRAGRGWAWTVDLALLSVPLVDALRVCHAAAHCGGWISF